LLNSDGCPEFPESEWTNILSGRVVNLDVVFGGRFTTSNDNRRTEVLGEIEIKYGTAVPKRTVTSVGDWVIAFTRTTLATTYAFPHRASELVEYSTYILDLFTATNIAFHDRIIAFDKAVRTRVGTTRSVELWDFERFADLKLTYVDSTGSGIGAHAAQSSSQSRQTGAGSKSSRKGEACNRWNDGVCTLTASACRRSHVCNICKKSGHKGVECKDRDKKP
jgi:hypothetical protein